MGKANVILRKKIDGLGAEGDIVSVRAGYSRNYLLPQKLAYEATAKNRDKLEELQAEREKREAEEMAQAEQLAMRINKAKVFIKLETGEHGKAFGSVTNMDINDELNRLGIELDRHLIQLEKPIKSSGLYEIPIKIHPQVECFLKVKVGKKRTEEVEKNEQEEPKE